MNTFKQVKGKLALAAPTGQAHLFNEGGQAENTVTH